MNPVFGSRLPGVPYRLREGAYAVIRDEEGRVAVVRNHRGLFLPGGGRESGETAVENLLRELVEECAREPEILRPIGEAMQFYSGGVHGWEMRATFFEATLGAPLPRVPDHELFWVAPEEACGSFFLECHAWAVRRALGAGHSGQTT